MKNQNKVFRLWILAFVLSFASGGCISGGKTLLESRFERDRPRLSVISGPIISGPTSESSCMGTGLEVYRDGSEVRLLDWSLESSTEFVIRKYYFSGGKPKVVVETRYWKYDASGELLSEPRLVSERRVDLTVGSARDQQELLEHAEFLVKKAVTFPVK